MLGHLPPKVLGVKDQPVKEKARDHFFAARAALVPADANPRSGATAQTPLKRDRGIEHRVALRAMAGAIAQHDNRTAALRARATGQHDVIVEPPGVLAQRRDGSQEGKAARDQVRSVGLT